MRNPDYNEDCNLSSEADIPEELSPVKIQASAHLRKMSQQVFLPSKYTNLPRNSNLIKSIVPNTKSSLELPTRQRSLFQSKRNLMIDEDILVTEPAESRLTTRISPNYQSVARSPTGRFGLSFALETSPKSVKSFTTLMTNMQLPKGDDESVFEEESTQSLETPTETMRRRVNEFYS